MNTKKNPQNKYYTLFNNHSGLYIIHVVIFCFCWNIFFIEFKLVQCTVYHQVLRIDCLIKGSEAVTYYEYAIQYCGPTHSFSMMANWNELIFIYSIRLHFNGSFRVQPLFLWFTIGYHFVSRESYCIIDIILCYVGCSNCVKSCLL